MVASAAVPLDSARQPGVDGRTVTDKVKAVARLQNIDALRGFVMVLMLLDHIRETWFLYVPVQDPMDVRVSLPIVVFARFLVSLCAPIFVALTGLGVYLFHSKHTIEETTRFLLKRGLLLMAIEVFFLSPLYWGIAKPTLWLQVIWCIGLCMIILAALIRLPRPALIGLGLVIVCGHNLLDPIQLAPGDALFPLWAELHQNAIFPFVAGLQIKTSYPILVWIGVMVLGYGIGPWFVSDVPAATRQRRLIQLGLGLLVAFVVLRAMNGYGDKPWSVVEGDPLRTALGFISLTKYPASLLFLMPTLGLGCLLLVLFERLQGGWLTEKLAIFGGAPMFFYLFHLSVLRILYHSALAIFGPNHDTLFGVSSYGWVLAWYVGLIVPLYIPTAWFSRLKKRRRDIAWLKYF
ncbi:heparan-alpha-glucosaminide N-acetyltransferase domain-containing protein [Novosphingobium sp. 1949]|uniref:Heparan-alpha-glucosaminide N-acetyltransferase domain-containing protein n=1 Tax=Novosphingobium organovorum TaxID=2930092 RepID=A0ABT0BDF6_9SPHN|nr:heparan-alpha-glucosaminide N-acetyltransferase domain-containing protein [Novosphingobium organovorum]MCJ2182940.1 heparan-alpha-glucosaminide N-acetyltransferase domain-containing protein [Novosphingobium organovorum]